jgi:LCP family protein required for cell wall assembly
VTTYDSAVEPDALDDLFGEPVVPPVADVPPAGQTADPHAALLARLSARPARQRRRRRPVLRRAITAAMSFTLLLGISAFTVARVVYAKYNGQIKHVAALERHDPNIRHAALQLHAENFLIIGSDTRQGEGAGFGNAAGARADTTILVHLSAGHHKATVISFPRDSWVHIPACKAADGSVVAAHDEMFNSAFSVGGPQCTVATVQELTGIAVTHYVEIDFSGFKKVVDALAGVSICSPRAVDDPKSHLHLKPGVNHLGGAQALAFVRARETLGDGSDLGRIRRQQMFLGAVLRQAMSGSLFSDPVRLTDVLDAITKAITLDTGTTLGDLRKLASSLSGLNPKKVDFYTAPIANRDYSPPGTGLTGKVLLDPVQGRVLYDSVIQDTGAPVKHAPASKPSASHAPRSSHPTGSASTSAVPAPDTNAATASCSL